MKKIKLLFVHVVTLALLSSCSGGLSKQDAFDTLTGKAIEKPVIKEENTRIVTGNVIYNSPERDAFYKKRCDPTAMMHAIDEEMLRRYEKYQKEGLLIIKDVENSKGYKDFYNDTKRIEITLTEEGEKYSKGRNIMAGLSGTPAGTIDVSYYTYEHTEPIDLRLIRKLSDTQREYLLFYRAHVKEVSAFAKVDGIKPGDKYPISKEHNCLYSLVEYNTENKSIETSWEREINESEIEDIFNEYNKIQK